jgi:hypothetical protein
MLKFAQCKQDEYKLTKVLNISTRRNRLQTNFNIILARLRNFNQFRLRAYYSRKQVLMIGIGTGEGSNYQEKHYTEATSLD